MEMEKKDRPLGREKKVVEGSAHVGRRDSGGGSPSSSGSASRGSGGGRKSPLTILIGVLAALLLGGGGALTNLLGGGDVSEQLSNLPQTSVSQSGGQHQSTTQTQGGSAINTQVSSKARAKRTVLQGNDADTATVMVYMCGTDLESKGGFATSDLQEMIAANLSDQVNLLVFTGGCTGWRNSTVSASKNQIFQVKRGGLQLLYESQLQPMTDPNTLSGFIQWGRKNFPADRYELIFWDHGGGSISGYGYDEAYPRSGSMTLDQISKALKDGRCAFDFVGFDACLMATLETALVVEPYADYLIASEETEPGCGWYYTNWLNTLSSHPSVSTLELGKAIVDSFVNTCEQQTPRQQATLSVIDLAELSGTVPGPFRDFATSTSASIKANDYQDVASARSNAKEFAQSSQIDQVDLIHLADNLGTPESKELAAVLREAVKYNHTSRNIQNANGVSIYFPYGKLGNVNRMTQTYDKIGLDASYSDCIKAFASLEVAGQAVSGGSASQLDSLFGALMGGGGGSASLSSEAVAQLLGTLLQGRSLPEVGLEEDETAFLDEALLSASQEYLTEYQFDASALSWTEKEGQPVISLPQDQWDLVQDIELNVFVDDGQGYIDLGLDNVFSLNDDGDLIGMYDGTWLCLDRQIVAYYMLSNEGTAEDYKIMGYVPAYLNDQRVDLILCFTDENPDGEVLGAARRYQEETETETIAKGLLPLEEGDVLHFVCNYYDYERNFQEEFLMGEPLTVSGPLEVANIRMDNTNYIAAYRFTDIYHNYCWTPSLP